VRSVLDFLKHHIVYFSRLETEIPFGTVYRLFIVQFLILSFWDALRERE
jgi:hypothetical protein